MLLSSLIVPRERSSLGREWAYLASVTWLAQRRVSTGHLAVTTRIDGLFGGIICIRNECCGLCYLTRVRQAAFSALFHAGVWECGGLRLLAKEIERVASSRETRMARVVVVVVMAEL